MLVSPRSIAEKAPARLLWGPQGKVTPPLDLPILDASNFPPGCRPNPEYDHQNPGPEVNGSRSDARVPPPKSEVCSSHPPVIRPPAPNRLLDLFARQLLV